MGSGPDEWWRTYFDGAVNEVFRLAMAARSPADAARIERVLALAPRSRIIDVPCGHGRIAIELAAHGHLVTGLDFSSEEIARARAAARDRNVEVAWTTGDMRTDVPAGPFDAAVCFGHSFGYFDDEGNASFLRGVARSLRPGGAFVIETAFCLESYLPRFSERSRPHWTQAGDTYLLQAETLDLEAGRLAIEQTYLTGAAGTVETKRISCRMYTYRELVAMMRACGFEDIRGLDGTGEEPFRVGGHLLLVGRRAGGA